MSTVATISRAQSIYDKEAAAYTGKNFARTKRGRELLASIKDTEKTAKVKQPMQGKTIVGAAKADAEYKRLYARYGKETAEKYADSVTTRNSSLISQTVIVEQRGKVVQTMPSLKQEDKVRAASIEDAFRSYKKKVDGTVHMIPGKIWSGTVDQKHVRVHWKRKDLPVTKPQAFVCINKGDSIPVSGLKDALEVIRAS